MEKSLLFPCIVFLEGDSGRIPLSMSLTSMLWECEQLSWPGPVLTKTFMISEASFVLGMTRLLRYKCATFRKHMLEPSMCFQGRSRHDIGLEKNGEAIRKSICRRWKQL